MKLTTRTFSSARPRSNCTRPKRTRDASGCIALRLHQAGWLAHLKIRALTLPHCLQQDDSPPSFLCPASLLT